MNQPTRGFTLVEVLVALVITALCAGVFVTQMTQSARQLQVLEDRTLATWLAQNVMAEYQIGLVSPTASASQTREMGRRQWRIETTTSTEDELVKIEIQVFAETSSDPILTLNAYQRTGML